jgi:transcriptional regulator with XRE-family HTH domain
MGIGQRIKSVREKRKISVARIATAARVKRQAVYAWESGDSKSLKGSHLVAVARELDVSVEWLDTGKGEPGKFHGDLPAIGPEAANAATELTPEALRLARIWMQLSPGRRAKYFEEIAWATFFESKFPPYRLGVANVASHEKFVRSVEADWDKMMRQAKLPLD